MTLSLILAKGGLFDPIAKPLAAVLAFFYSLVPNYGIAIVLLTIAMMIVLTPLTIKQTRSMLVMQKLQPEMKKLQEQHKNDRQALNEAVMQLYKEHNASPLGGCLPMLLPFPLFIALLRVLEGLSHKGVDPLTKAVVSMPKYLTAHTQMAKDIIKAHGELDAFGMNLAKSARNVGGGFAHSLPYFILLLVMVGTQFYQQYQLTSRNPAAQSQPGQAAMMKFIPIFFGLISLNFPAGVVLYWTVSNVIRIGQQWALYKYDPKVKALVVKDVKEIEANTKVIEAKSKAATSGQDNQDKAPRRSFRDLLANASEAAAERRGQGGKGVAKPGSGTAGAKPGAAARGGRPQPPKAAGGTPGSARPKAPGAPGAAKRPQPTKGAPQKAAPQKGSAPKGLPSKAAPKVVPAKQAPAKAAGVKASGSTSKAVPSPVAGAKKAAVPTKSTGATGGANGASQPAATSAPGNGAAKSGANGAPTSPGGSAASGEPTTNGAPGNGAPGNGAPGNGAPARGGRTGGASSRNVSSRRRRRGR